MDAETSFLEIGGSILGADKAQMFGKPCFKKGGKAFVCFFQDEMVFKLDDEKRDEALALAGAQLFDPSGKKRPMKQWVQLPIAHVEHWPEFAKYAANLLV